jgi:hypothetical protein
MAADRVEAGQALRRQLQTQSHQVPLTAPSVYPSSTRSDIVSQKIPPLASRAREKLYWVLLLHAHKHTSFAPTPPRIYNTCHACESSSACILPLQVLNKLRCSPNPCVPRGPRIRAAALSHSACLHSHNCIERTNFSHANRNRHF